MKIHNEGTVGTISETYNDPEALSMRVNIAYPDFFIVSKSMPVGLLKKCTKTTLDRTLAWQGYSSVFNKLTIILSL